MNPDQMPDDNQAENGGRKAAPDTASRDLSCDQVAWLMDVFERHLPPSRLPAVSRQREMQKYAMLYEVMEVAGLSFQDAYARMNGTPSEVRESGSPVNEPSGRGRTARKGFVEEL